MKHLVWWKTLIKVTPNGKISTKNCQEHSICRKVSDIKAVQKLQLPSVLEVFLKFMVDYTR